MLNFLIPVLVCCFFLNKQGGEKVKIKTAFFTAMVLVVFLLTGCSDSNLGTKELFSQKTEEGFILPVPENVITTFFSETYVFSGVLGKHSGIDIRASQGTPVKASASGYVAKIKDGGMGCSYIVLAHPKNIHTFYGHLLRISVKYGDKITQGQIIGLSGGKPGTPGAGKYSTGAHLHFEVLVDKKPVNPLPYLLYFEPRWVSSGFNSALIKKEWWRIKQEGIENYEFGMAQKKDDFSWLPK